MLLIDKLKEYGKSDFYAFHMPGHKRQEELGITSFPNPFSVDITEIDGFDNLHHAEGILKESMDKVAEIYGADKTYYLVNGSTGGILSAISGAVTEGGMLLMARNSHKSAYHAAFLRGLGTMYVYPRILEEYGISGGIDPEEIERILRADRNNQIQAVFITSPTYEGIVSDIEKIAEIVHKRDLPLIVDEAHGAHFPFYSGAAENRRKGRLFPKSALECGADVVIQSLHKTLPSLTQTALLHLKGDRIRREKIEFYLRIYQSSSPSYVFLSSIENCIIYMNGKGRERLAHFGGKLEQWVKQAENWHFLELLDDKIVGYQSVFDRDLSKLVVSVRYQARQSGWNGTRLADEVRRRFHLESEMSCDGYVIFMTSLMDCEKELSKLMDSLSQIDKEIGAKSLKEVKKSGELGESVAFQRLMTWVKNPEVVMRMNEALSREEKFVRLEKAAGLVSSGFLTVYPPGVPAIVPGERISEEAVQMLLNSQRLGLTVEGIDKDGWVAVVMEDGQKER